MKAVRFHEHGGPEVLRFEDAPDPVAGSGPGDRPRPRVRAESPRSLAAPRPRSRHASRCRTSRAATSPARSSIRRRPIAAGQRVMLQPGSQLRPVRGVPGRPRQPVRPSYDVLGYALGRRLRRARLGAGREPDRRFRRHVDFIDRGRVPADVPDGVAHAHDARRPARRRRRPRARGRQRRRPGRHPARAALRRARVRDVGAREGRPHARARGRATCSITTPETSRARSAASPAAAAPTSSSSTSARRPGTAASARWRRGGRLVTCGATTGHAAAVDLRHLFARQLSLLGSYMGTLCRARCRRAAPLRRAA